MVQIALWQDEDFSDKRPYPLIVANKWKFRLDHIGGDPMHFSVRGWLAGLLDEKYADQVVKDWRRGKGLIGELVDGVHSLDEPSRNGRNRREAYATDEALYRMVQDIVENTRTQKRDMTRVNEIKRFLAKAGVYADKTRRDPKWAAARLEGVIARSAFTEALAQTVIDMTQQGYGTATNDVYRGVFHRDTAQLKAALNTDKPREKMSQPALHYLGIAEWACAQHIGEAESISFSEARTIIQDVAGLVGVQVGELERHFNIDIVTGKPPLPSGAK
jgi:hypothetical protein